MSKVTIGEITEDLLPFTKKGDQVIPIEIIPRKIVEDIIKKCEDKCAAASDCSPIDVGKRYAYTDIRRFANMLLKKFDEA